MGEWVVGVGESGSEITGLKKGCRRQSTTRSQWGMGSDALKGTVRERKKGAPIFGKLEKQLG